MLFIWKDPFSPPDITQAEIDEVVDTLRSGWITTGPKSKQFEREIAAYCGTDTAVCLNSATASLELTPRVLGIGPGDEVIVPAYTYTATASPVCHVGATLVMVDSQPDCYEMDYAQLEKPLRRAPRPSSRWMWGGSCVITPVFFPSWKIAGETFSPASPLQAQLGRIAVIADGAHSFGAGPRRHPQRCMGGFHHLFFHAVKNLTTAEGGAVTWRRDLGLMMRRSIVAMPLSLHGQDKDALAKTKAGAWEYDIVAPLYKCNMTDIMAAIGLAQLHRYEELLAKRYALVEQYHELLASTAIRPARHLTEDGRSSCHLYLTELEGRPFPPAQCRH